MQYNPVLETTDLPGKGAPSRKVIICILTLLYKYFGIDTLLINAYVLLHMLNIKI